MLQAMHFKNLVHRLPWALSLAAALGALGACSATPGSMTEKLGHLVTPYRVEVVQGNVVTQEQMAVVKPGLTRDQVRQVLGAPLLADPFHADRWDYVFLIRRQGTEPQQRAVVIHFSGDTVQRVDAPELPTERDFVTSISRKKPSEVERKLELTPQERAALPLPAPREQTVAAATAAAGPARSYPPLEAP
jgi:outer membrane protein assembly factor BamE